MKKLITYNVFVSQDVDKPLVVVQPSFIFSCEFDSDIESSFNKVVDIENSVKSLYNAFSELGCKCFVSREEITHLYDNSISSNDNSK